MQYGFLLVYNTFHFSSNRKFLKVIYRVFRLDSTAFISQVKQHKLDSCSMSCLSKILQKLCYRHYLNYLFSKNSNLGTKNSIDIYFTPKNSKCNVVISGKKKLGIQVGWFVKYDEFNVQTDERI